MEEVKVPQTFLLSGMETRSSPVASGPEHIALGTTATWFQKIVDVSETTAFIYENSTWSDSNKHMVSFERAWISSMDIRMETDW